MTSNDPPQTPGPPNRRRSSIAELFQPRSSTSPNSNTNPATFPSAMSSIQSRPNPRRVSISTTLGLSGSPTNTQSSPFGTYPRRRDSVSSSQDSGSPNNEDAVVEDNEGTGPANTPVTPFARRVSWGAQAFGSVRSGNGSFSNGEGFNWGDNLREKSSRPPLNPIATSNVNAQPPPSPPQPQRAASIATMEPPKQMPVPQPQTQYKPDHLGERMLRGEFMMD